MTPNSTFLDILGENQARFGEFSRCLWRSSFQEGKFRIADIERAAYAYPHQPELVGYLTLLWHKMDHWFEEVEEVFVHARDPYKRVDIRVVLDGELQARPETYWT
jgi:hypothetical protein